MSVPVRPNSTSNPAYCYSEPTIIRPHPVTPSGRPPTKMAKDDGEENKESTEPTILNGGCSCGKLKYQLRLESKDDARTSLCHCKSCKKAFGGAFGVTVKIPLQSFRYLEAGGAPTLHKGDNGSGATIYREFCNACGSYICEYGEQAKDIFRYITLGSLDDPSVLPPKGEFFCSQREQWMPEIPGLFQKQYIKE